MNIGMHRGNFPKSREPESALEERERYERWIVETHHSIIADAKRRAADDERWLETRHIDPEYDAVMLQPEYKPDASHPSKKAAIRARCWQCQAGDTDEGGTQRIKTCSSTDCALWSVRPYQEGPRPQVSVPVPASVFDHGAKALANPGNRAAAVKGFCHQCCGGQPDKLTMREVYSCAIGQCAMWRVRPGASRRSETEDEVPAENQKYTPFEGLQSMS